MRASLVLISDSSPSSLTISSFGTDKDSVGPGKKIPQLISFALLGIQWQPHLNVAMKRVNWLNNWFWDVAHLICDCPPWIPLSKHHIYALISFLHSVEIATVSEIGSVQQLGKYHLEIQVLSELLLAGSEEDLWKCLPHSENELLLLDLLFWGQGNVSVDGFWYKRSGTVFHNFRNFVGGFSAFQGDWHCPSKSIRDVKSEN